MRRYAPSKRCGKDGPAHSKADEKGLGGAIIDLLHADYGKIDQHWDVIQAVSEKTVSDNCTKAICPTLASASTGYSRTTRFTGKTNSKVVERNNKPARFI